MGAKPELIFCADGNPAASALAVAIGYRYGARLPATVYQPVWFADQEWKRPNRVKYMNSLSIHRPEMATVLDWEHDDQFHEVISWAEEAAAHANQVVIIPKIPGTIPRIPHKIGGARVVIGYSVPTRYGSTSIPLWELSGRPVHLLGGSPQKQIEIWRYLSVNSNVVSADGNMSLKMANTRCCYWVRHSLSPWGHWQPISREVETDAPIECLKRSLVNIFDTWSATK